MNARANAISLFLGGSLGLGGFGAGLMIAWAALPAVAHAQPAPAAANAPAPASRRTSSLVVYGNDPCPAGGNGEIVVCARRPESERYRLPRQFRGKRASESPAANSWANKNEATEQASRTAAGLPDTCSAVGSGGQSGCYRQFLSQARAQRQADKQDAATAP